MRKGNAVPSNMLTATIMTSDAVIAIVSLTGVKNTAARKHPATPKTKLRTKQDFTSPSK